MPNKHNNQTNHGDNHDAEEVEVGDAAKLFEEILWQEVPPRVPRCDHPVAGKRLVGVWACQKDASMNEGL
jgi:hypothetical protein